MKKSYIFLAILLVIIVIGVIIYNVKGNDPYLVNALTSSVPWYDQAGSIDQIAIQKNDISVCDRIHIWGYVDGGEEHLTNQCKSAYAAAFPKENICLKDKGACDLPTIVKLGDPAACFGDAYCVSALAYKKNDLNICEQFLTGQQGDKSFPTTSPLYNLIPSQKCRWYISQDYFTSPRE
jgi:hypothetical protein